MKGRWRRQEGLKRRKKGEEKEKGREEDMG